jgi:hypothetical protein
LILARAGAQLARARHLAPSLCVSPALQQLLDVPLVFELPPQLVGRPGHPPGEHERRRRVLRFLPLLGPNGLDARLLRRLDRLSGIKLTSDARNPALRSIRLHAEPPRDVLGNTAVAARAASGDRPRLTRLGPLDPHVLVTVLMV